MINIPLKVDSVTQAQRRYGYILSNLESEGFKDEHKKFIKKKNGVEVLEDVAVIFGMNGKHTPQLAQVMEELKKAPGHVCKINYSIVTYTWGKGGTIAQDVPEGKIPYRDIREHLKKEAGNLVDELRGNDPGCLVYFSFVDSDTVKFNTIYSEYLEIVREELKKDDSIPPTVMSTSYELNHDSEHWIASRIDREVRTAIAEEHPLLVYYPEPNFCVLLRKGLNTLDESFVGTRRKKGEYTMESPVLIRQLKDRPDFKAVFDGFFRRPIIIQTPDRFKLKDKGLITGQSHLDRMNMATGMLANMAITPGDKTSTWYYSCRGAIMRLYNCKSDQDFEKTREEVRKQQNIKTIDENEFKILIESIKAARAYKQFVYELEDALPENSPRKK